MYSGGYFNGMPAYSGRVEMTLNAGLVIRHVTTSENGNYSVEVNGLDASGSFIVLRRTAQVIVGSMYDQNTTSLVPGFFYDVRVSTHPHPSPSHHLTGLVVKVSTWSRRSGV